MVLWCVLVYGWLDQFDAERRRLLAILREEMAKTNGMPNDVTDECVRKLFILMIKRSATTRQYTRENIDWLPLIMMKVGEKTALRIEELRELRTFMWQLATMAMKRTVPMIILPQICIFIILKKLHNLWVSPPANAKPYSVFAKRCWTH